LPAPQEDGDAPELPEAVGEESAPEDDE